MSMHGAETSGAVSFKRLKAFGGFHVPTGRSPLRAREGLSEVAVLWASPDMMALSLPRDTRWTAGEVREFELWSRLRTVGQLRGVIRSINDTEFERVALVDLAPSSLDKARRLMSIFVELMIDDELLLPPTRVASEEQIHDVGRIQAAVLAMRATETSARVRRGQDVQVSTLRIADVRPGPFPIVWEVDDAQGPLSSPFVIEATGYNSLYNLPINRFELTGGRLVSEMPRWIRRLRHRWHRRADSNRALDVRFNHPTWPEIRVDARLLDVSARGFSTAVDTVQALLYPGLRLPHVEILDRGRTVVSGSAFVRSVQLGGEQRVGLEFESEDRLSQARWERLVSDMLHPHTMPGFRMLDGTWDTYEESGYFSLSGKSPQHFKRLRTDFTSASRQLARAPRLASHAVWSNDGDVSATISMAKSHDHTWLVYQLARSHKNPSEQPGGKVLRELYFRCYEDAERDPDLRWLLAYVQTSAHWSRVIHYDLVRQFEEVDPGVAHTHRFRALEIDTRMPRTVRRSLVRVGSATSEELAVLANAATNRYSEVWAEALDLVVGRMDSPASGSSYRRAGLERDRAIFVARTHGVPQAAIICDTTSEGIHLFGLLDTARIVPLGGTRPTDDVISALLHSATEWFFAHDKRFCVLLDDADYLHAESSTYIEDMGQADQTILSAAAIPEMLEYVQSKTHPREWARVLEDKRG